MKKYIYILIGVVLQLSTTGCNDFLDEQPRGSAIAETTDDYNGLFNATQMMNMLYADYTKWLNPDIVHTATTLQNLNVQSTYNMTGNTTYSISSANAYRLLPNPYVDVETCDMWGTIFQRIYVYNMIANGVMDSRGGTELQKKALRAEARISRAWLHFLLLQVFSKPYQMGGDDELSIPIVSEANSMQTDFTLVTKKAAYSFIENELTESVEDLEDRPDHKMRIYKTTGYALLGKYYWLTGQYEKATAPLRAAYERLKNEADFGLINYNDYDSPGNPDTNLSNSYVHPYFSYSSEALWVKQNSGFRGASMLGSYGPAYYISKELYELYDEYDIRRNYVPTSAKVTDYVYNPETGGWSLITKEQAYEAPVGCIRGNQENYGVEIPEVYLALAECEARSGSLENARNLLAEFRCCRLASGHEGVPENVITRNDLIVFCVDEQRREFADRQNGFYTLRRLWDDPVFQYRKPYTRSDGEQTFTMTEDNLYFRLPEGVLKWNDQWRNIIND
ncbi:MAG: RagB/SusD family nutrient uptake outer membrane protein [Prevotella sp.]|nr:RagB/SusD family nutrient uptake outer membrane protein [Prevotella sp.]